MTGCSCHSHGSFLTAKGLEEAAQRELGLHGIDAMEPCCHLDKVGSVSGSPLQDTHWDDEIIDQQHRRFHHGS